MAQQQYCGHTQGVKDMATRHADALASIMRVLDAEDTPFPDHKDMQTIRTYMKEYVEELQANTASPFLGTDFADALGRGMELLAPVYKHRALIHRGDDIAVPEEVGEGDPILSSFDTSKHANIKVIQRSLLSPIYATTEREVLKNTRGIYILLVYKEGGKLLQYYVRRANGAKGGVWHR